MDAEADRYSIVFEEENYSPESLKPKLQYLLQIPGNQNCIECDEKDPLWASVSLGVFICTTCAGSHRTLGVHISRVRSLILDNWKREDLESLRDMGNTKARKKWEGFLPLNFVRPSPQDSASYKEWFIRLKYEYKSFLSPSGTSDNTKLPAKEGWLTKQGAVVKNWKKRWFVLYGVILSYYKKPKELEPAGEIDLKEATSIDCVSENIEGKTFCFSIKTPEREYFISTDDGKSMFEWIQIMKSSTRLSSVENPEGKLAADLDLKQVIHEMVNGVNKLELQKRKAGKKAVFCFQGVNAIDWMIVHLDIKSRLESVALGKRLETEGFIKSCSDKEVEFVDDLSTLPIPKNVKRC